jgi:hypothetical protein
LERYKLCFTTSNVHADLPGEISSVLGDSGRDVTQEHLASQMDIYTKESLFAIAILKPMRNSKLLRYQRADYKKVSWKILSWPLDLSYVGKYQENTRKM